MKKGSPFLYHLVLKSIYENFGTDWFTFRNFWDLNVVENEVELSARQRMNYSFSYGFLEKKSWKIVKKDYPDLILKDKRSSYWRVQKMGLRELSIVFKDLKIKEKHISILAKMLLEDNK